VIVVQGRGVSIILHNELVTYSVYLLSGHSHFYSFVDVIQCQSAKFADLSGILDLLILIDRSVLISLALHLSQRNACLCIVRSLNMLWHRSMTLETVWEGSQWA
jgi:hypothetical protein